MTLNQSVLLFQDTWWDSSLNLLIQKDWTEPKHFMEAFQKSYFCRLVQDNPNVPGESGLMASDLKWHCWIIYPCFPAVWIHLKINAAKTAAPGATSYELPYLPGPSRADHIFTQWQTFSFVFSSICSKSGILTFDQSDHYKISQNLIHISWSTYLTEVFSYKIFSLWLDFKMFL